MLIRILLAAFEQGVHTVAKAVRDWSQRPDSELVTALRQGDTHAFNYLVRKHAASMRRVAIGLLRDDAVTAEVVQETWETVLRELSRFRGEAALSTWIYRILINRAKRVGKREGRSIPFSSLARDAEQEDRPDIVDEFTWYGRWSSPVHGWRVLDQENESSNRQISDLVKQVLETIPESQRVVVTLRDVEGLDSNEVCQMLGISEGNQRVLLHRGRTRIRLQLEAKEKELSR
ncbi:MAG: sigma-70 family RNA polymerase sigma factor [Myxococcota bacterium]|jgi:RNA polymerase sigma-70 factor (ECF subfamily)|nr:sigma-70 family RNA polymerase sigma factor [Myxococcota bacterium]